MFFTGHTASGFLVAQLLGFSLDAGIIIGLCSNLSDLEPLAIDGEGKWDNLYKVWHHPDKSIVASLWLFILINIVFFFRGLHWLTDFLTHKKEGGKNWFYWVLDLSFSFGSIYYCYINYWS